MKKIFYALMCLALVACGSEKTANISSDTSKETVSTIMSAKSIMSQMEKGSYVQGELLVKFKPKASAERVHRAVGASVIRSYTAVANLQHVKLPANLSVENAILQYMADPDVEYAEPNYIRKTLAIVPNDTYFRDQWALWNTGQYAYGTPGADIKATDAWEVSIGSGDISVAVLDTGIDYNHSDLVWNVWRNTRECSGTAGTDDDANGFTDDCMGWDFTTCGEFDDNGTCVVTKLRDNDPFDENGHGTHVSGIIGAKGHNSTGIAGIMWMVNLVPLQVCNSQGYCETADVIAAIDYGILLRNAGVNIRVMNASFGGDQYSASERDALSRANTAGILFVAAAGNGGDDGIGDNNDMTPFYPASYDLSNIISVAATDQDDRRVPFSNFGPLSVDVAAPGTYILSTIPQNTYSDKEFSSGTSMAAPHVSGLAGLLSAYYSHLTHTKIRDMILRYVDMLPTLNGWIATGGRINAYRAMSSLWAPTVFVATPLSPSQISLAWIERATDEQGYRLERRTEGGVYALLANLSANSNSYQDNGLTDGTKYYYRARAYNDIGDSPAYLTNETSAVTPLTPPTGLHASALSTSQIRLFWNDNSQSEDGYKIERKVQDGSFVEIAQVGPNTAVFTDSGLNTNTSYGYRVRAFSTVAGNSAYSEEITAKTLSTNPHHGGGGGGCSIGVTPNTPTAIADLVILLIPFLSIAIMRRRR